MDEWYDDYDIEEGDTVAMTVISLGWGVQSWTLAAMAALGKLPPVDYAIHADTTHEARGTYDHAAKWTPWLEEHGVKVVTVQSNNTDVVRDEWGKQGSVLIPAFSLAVSNGAMGQVRRQCTHDWKIAPIRRFIRSVLNTTRPAPGSVRSWQGISVDEWHRMRSSDVAYVENVYPLVDLRMSRADCVAWLQDHGLDAPPKSACTFCPYHNARAWEKLKRSNDIDWQRAVEVDRAIRDKRQHVGFSLYVHPARKPLPEAVSIPEDMGAQQLELDIPCDSGMCFV